MSGVLPPESQASWNVRNERLDVAEKPCKLMERSVSHLFHGVDGDTKRGERTEVRIRVRKSLEADGDSLAQAPLLHAQLLLRPAGFFLLLWRRVGHADERNDHTMRLVFRDERISGRVET